MDLVVIDASISAGWYIPDEKSNESEALWGRIGFTVDAIAPPLWFYEMGNLLLKCIKLGRLSQKDAVRSVQILESAEIRIVENASYPLVFALSQRYGLAYCAAAYLAFAMQHQCALATLDKALVRAAPQAGIQLFTP